MCGRYQFSAHDEDVIQEINKILKRIDEKYNQPQIHLDEILPTNTVPVIKNENGKQDFALMSWGFRRNDGSININSRSEKRLFAEAYKTRRCVIPASGFYEYRASSPKKPKDKYLFVYPNAPMIYMAGIYKTVETENGKQDNFVILTREANEYVKDIHNRMPVMLYQNEIAEWINDDKFAVSAADRGNVPLEKRLIVKPDNSGQISLF